MTDIFLMQTHRDETFDGWAHWAGEEKSLPAQWRWNSYAMKLFWKFCPPPRLPGQEQGGYDSEKKTTFRSVFSKQSTIYLISLFPV